MGVYLYGMTAEAILEKNLRFDRGGKPVEVVIPYDKFIDFIESHGLDLKEDERQELRETIKEVKSGEGKSYSAEEAKRELGLI